MVQGFRNRRYQGYHWHPQFLADQLTNNHIPTRGGGGRLCPPFNTGTPKFLNFSASLWWSSHYYLAGSDCKKAKAGLLWPLRLRRSPLLEVKDQIAQKICTQLSYTTNLLLPYKVQFSLSGASTVDFTVLQLFHLCILTTFCTNLPTHKIFQNIRIAYEVKKMFSKCVLLYAFG